MIDGAATQHAYEILAQECKHYNLPWGKEIPSPSIALKKGTHEGTYKVINGICASEKEVWPSKLALVWDILII